MLEHTLPDHILDTKPDIYELTSYAKTDKWKELGIQLKLDNVNRNECNSCAGLYELWLEEKGRYATRRTFLAALRAIKQNETADDYVVHLQTTITVSDIVKDNLHKISWRLHRYDRWLVISINSGHQLVLHAYKIYLNYLCMYISYSVLITN